MNEIEEILSEAKVLAKKYKKLTGKPLGITGEIAEFAAAQALGLKLSAARQSGYDATRTENGKEVKVQIKGRCVGSKPNPGQRLGKIRLDTEWDTVVLVLLDMEFEPLSMIEASRSAVEDALLAPGSKARNERGALGVGKFKSIGTEVWSRERT